MTGYGRGRSEGDGWRAVVEIRSVNHRYVDLKLRGSSLNPALEDKISTAVRAQVERGAISVSVRIERAAGDSGMRVDQAVARRLHHDLADLATTLHMAPPHLELICAQPGVLVPVEVDTDSSSLRDVVLAAANEAIAGLVSMRAAEGANLAADLTSRFARLGELVEEIQGLTAEAPAEAQRRLQERLGKLLSGSNIEVDPDRLAHEVAIIADRMDVTEELVRLRSHLEQVGEVIAAEGAVGRRIGFLVQEVGREFNTVGSKSQSADVARCVVDAKAELEKIREQVQNIE
jgi:uncharacterized protein (TIGR00255 family)